MFGSSGKTSNPLGVVGAVVGAIGAGFSILLWLYHFNPDSTILGSYSAQMIHGGQLADQLGTLAIVFGGIAVVLASSAASAVAARAQRCCRSSSASSRCRIRC